MKSPKQLATDYFLNLEPPRLYNSTRIMDAYSDGYMECKKFLEIIIAEKDLEIQRLKSLLEKEEERPITEQDFL